MLFWTIKVRARTNTGWTGQDCELQASSLLEIPFFFFFFCHQGNRNRNDKCFPFVNIFHGYFWFSGEKQSIDISQFKTIGFTFHIEGGNVVDGLKIHLGFLISPSPLGTTVSVESLAGLLPIGNISAATVCHILELSSGKALWPRRRPSRSDEADQLQLSSLL